jgi:hypothetical protein
MELRMGEVRRTGNVDDLEAKWHERTMQLGTVEREVAQKQKVGVCMRMRMCMCM